MSIVDLHDVKLLNDLLVDPNLPVLESWNDRLPKVNGEDIMELIQSLNLLVNVFNLVHHSVGIVCLEHASDGLSALSQVVQVTLCRLLLLLVLTDPSLKLVLLLQSRVDCLNVKELSLAPVIQVEVGILHSLAQLEHTLLDDGRGGLDNLRVAEDHLLLLSIDVLCQVELLVLVEHVQHRLVVLNALGLVLHVESDRLLHLLQDRDDLLGEVLELLAIEVQLVLLKRVVEMVLDLEGFSHPLDSLRDHLLSHGSESLRYVTVGSRERHHLLRVDQERETGHLLEESLQVETALIDEFDVLVSNSLLGRQLREGNAGPSEL